MCSLPPNKSARPRFTQLTWNSRRPGISMHTGVVSSAKLGSMIVRRRNRLSVQQRTSIGEPWPPGQGARPMLWSSCGRNKFADASLLRHYLRGSTVFLFFAGSWPMCSRVVITCRIGRCFSDCTQSENGSDGARVWVPAYLPYLGIGPTHVNRVIHVEQQSLAAIEKAEA